MTTDITELAQSLKAAAENATPGLWYVDPDFDVCDEDRDFIAELHGGNLENNALFIALANPANVRALVEALELKEEQRANWFQMAQKSGENLDAAEKRIAELEGALEVSQGDLSDTEDAMHLWAERAKKADRTVTVEPFRSFVTDADLAALHRFAECCDDPESGGHDLEKEQVRRLEAIGALQRSGRISYITDFGDFLISITSGIKWEAE